jgi:hypothetical protein
VRALAHVLVAAGAVWLLSEILEVVAGGRTAATLWLTALFHLLLAIGIWGAYLAQPGARSPLSRLGVAAASVGYLVLILPPILVAQSASLDLPAFMSAHAWASLAALLAVLGTVAFGVAILRGRSYPGWIGALLVACPLALAIGMAAGAPDLVVIAANAVQSVALIQLGRLATARLG